MKKLVCITILTLLTTFSIPPVANAQSTNEELDRTPEAAAGEIKLTPSGSAFANGAADGQCTIAGAACTIGDKTPGVCADNGKGFGTCRSSTPTIDPLFDTGCKPDEICHIAPEKVSRDLQGGQSDNKTYGFDPIGHIRDYIEEWFGDVKPDSQYHYGTELLTKFGFQVQDASYNDLTPATIQEMTLHDYQPKRFCTTSRICLSNPWSDEPNFYQFLTTETWCTEDPPGRRELIEGTRRIACALTDYECSTDFQLPDTRVKKLAALTCGTPMDEGKHMDLSSLDFIKKNNYGEDAVTHWVVNLVAALVTGPTQVETKDGVFKDIWTSHIPSNAREKGSSENSMAASLAGISFTVSEQDLKPFAYPGPEGKTALTKVGGLWNTYRNDAFDPGFKTLPDAIYDTQPWDVNVTGFHPTEAPTLQSMNARQEQAQVFGNCSILPAGLQGKVFANGECDQNWAGESAPSSIASVPPADSDAPTSSWALVPNGSSSNPISPSFKPPSSITAGNALALVPACVLEGVAQIEGAYEGGAPCKPNECGAYGPFQITTGNCKPSCGASSCPNAAQQLGVTKDDLCDFNSAAYHAARLLVGKSKYFGYPLTNADPKSQKQAIIIAGDSYYGTPKPVARLGGLSYGEWVYAHCDPTYKTHVDHSFPTPSKPL